MKRNEYIFYVGLYTKNNQINNGKEMIQKETNIEENQYVKKNWN